MSAGEAVIRKRAAAATDQNKAYVEYLRREDVVDLLAEMDDLRLRAGLVAIPAGAHVVQAEVETRQYAVRVDELAAMPVLMPDLHAPVDLSGGWPVVRGVSDPTSWRAARPATPAPDGFGSLFVTFGVQYAREPHPTLPWAHPDGYLQVQYRLGVHHGHAWNRARTALLQWTEAAFATTYDSLDDELLPYVPWGELALMVLP